MMFGFWQKGRETIGNLKSIRWIRLMSVWLEISLAYLAIACLLLCSFFCCNWIAKEDDVLSEQWLILNIGYQWNRERERKVVLVKKNKKYEINVKKANLKFFLWTPEGKPQNSVRTNQKVFFFYFLAFCFFYDFAKGFATTNATKKESKKKSLWIFSFLFWPKAGNVKRKWNEKNKKQMLNKRRRRRRSWQMCCSIS